jgi:protoporphyrinogen oxidase
MTEKRIIIIGAGPAGMAAALEATRLGARPLIVEKLDRVGGLSRTVERDGNRFDIGPHRFFTLNEEVRALFAELCGEDLVRVPRLTRISYRNRYFDYPLTPVSALLGLGLAPSVRVLASYAGTRLRHLAAPPTIASFEDWVIDRFGRRLYETFFKSYTEKVWGIPCRRIGADWAAQRIKGLSLATAVAHALFGSRKGVVKTLVDEFVYPRLGAGQLYEKMADAVLRLGGKVVTDTEVLRVSRNGFEVNSIYCRGAMGSFELHGDFFLSSAPLTELIGRLDPPPPPEIVAAARSLRYRNHIAVNLVASGPAPFPDNWIYVHSAELRMARIASYANFSKDMAAGPGLHPLTVEYFCHPDEEIWRQPDAELFALAIGELRRIGITGGAVTGAFVVRSEKAYPVIENGYREKIAIIKAHLDRFENLLPIGRSGMFKYNNQDHAIATGLYAARTALGMGRFDPWQVNIDGIYHEGGAAQPTTARPSHQGGLPPAPVPARA